MFAHDSSVEQGHEPEALAAVVGRRLSFVRLDRSVVLGLFLFGREGYNIIICTLILMYRVIHLLRDLSWVDFDFIWVFHHLAQLPSRF